MERNPVIGDTGFVVALVNQADTMHGQVVQVYARQKQILLPQTVLAEVAYLIGRGSFYASNFFARITCKSLLFGRINRGRCEACG